MQEYVCDKAYDVEDDFALLQEWESIQRTILTFALKTLHSATYSKQHMIEGIIRRCTKGRACIYWGSVTLSDVQTCDRLCEIRYQDRCYGFLGFSPGYLASNSFPNIAQDFTSLCAFLLSFAEYQALIQYQLEGLPSLSFGECTGTLTRREREVLLGIVRGESDVEMAEELGIEPTTVHTHRKRLYLRLGVHSAQEATLRSFTHRLVNWLDEPNKERLQVRSRILGKRESPAHPKREP